MTDDNPLLPTTRRTVLQTLSSATVASLLAQSASATGDAGLRVDSFDDDLGLPSDAVREARWVVQDRRQYAFQPHHDLDDMGPTAPVWVGAAQTQFEPVNVSWEPYGNPDPEADERGCWRVTFNLSSSAYSLAAVEGSRDGDRLVIDEDDGYMLTDSDLDHIWDEADLSLGNELRVEGPALEGDGDDWNYIAFGVRRDQDFFSALDGNAIVQFLRDNPDLRADFADSWGELVASMGRFGAVNARNEYALVQDAKKDAKAWRDIAMVVVGAVLGVFAAAGVTIAIVLNSALSMLGTVLGIQGLLTGTGPSRVPYYRGFQLNDPAERGGPMTAHNALFDVYVSPGERVEFTIESTHDLNQTVHETDVNSITDNEWDVEIDMRDATSQYETEASLYENISLTRGWHAGGVSYDSFDRFRKLSEKGPQPVARLQNGAVPAEFSLNADTDPADALPYVPTGEDVHLDAYDTKLWYDSQVSSNEIGQYEWSVYRLGPTTDPTEHDFAPEEVSQTDAGWPDIGRSAVASSSRGDHPEWSCSLDEPGTYAVVLAVDDALPPSEGGGEDGGFRNFVIQKFVYGSYLSITNLYAAETSNPDEHIGGETIPSGTEVLLTGEYDTLDDSAVEPMWVIPEEPGIEPTEEMLERRGPWLDDLELVSGTEATFQFLKEGTYHPMFVVQTDDGTIRSETLTVETETELSTLYTAVESTAANGSQAGPPFTVGETLRASGEFMYAGANEVEETWIRATTEGVTPQPHMLEEVGVWSDDIEILTEAAPTFAFSEPGEYDLLYHVEDPVAEATSSTHATVEVVEAGDEVDHPFVDAVHAELEMTHEGDRLTVGDHVTLDATSSYAERDRSILGYDWNLTGTGVFVDLGDPGKAGILDEGVQRMPLYDGFDEAGTYSPSVLVYAWNPEEERVEVNSDTVSFTVFEDAAATADITRLSPADDAVSEWKLQYVNTGGDPFWEAEPYVAWFSARESDFVNGVDEFRWTIDGEESTAIRPGPVYHIFDEPGSYDVTLELVYDNGETATTTQEVSIGNGATSAEITQLSPGDDAVEEWKRQWTGTGGDAFWETADHLVWLSARNSARTDEAEEFRWEFAHPGDGPDETSYTEGPVHHEYDRADTFEVRLEVVYSDGSTASTTAMVDTV